MGLVRHNKSWVARLKTCRRLRRSTHRCYLSCRPGAEIKWRRLRQKLLDRCTSRWLAPSRPHHTSAPEGKQLPLSQQVRGQCQLQRQSHSKDKAAHCQASCQAGMTQSVAAELQGTEDPVINMQYAGKLAGQQEQGKNGLCGLTGHSTAEPCQPQITALSRRVKGTVVGSEGSWGSGKSRSTEMVQEN